MRIAILGGTGAEGLGIAARLAVAGDDVVLGSRSAERAAQAAAELEPKLGGAKVTGAANAEAAEGADMVFLSVPYDGLAPLFEACGDVLADKLLVDIVVPLYREKGVFLSRVPEAGSVGEEIRDRLPGARVVSAFKNQSAHELLAIEHPVAGDVLLCGDDDEAKAVVSALVKKIPDLRPVDAGALGVSRHLESVTALLLNLNRKHKAHSTIQILGI